MQVNLRHHAQAFSSLEQAFDPAKNVAYSASFLRSLYEESRSWKKAAADYHSKTPGRGSKYVGMVYDSWERLVEKLRVAQLKVPESSLAEMRDMSAVKYNASRAPVSSLAPASGGNMVYANALPKSVTAKVPAPKVTPLGDQVGRNVAVYQSPRMKSIEISKRNTYKENGVIVVKPDVQPEPRMQASAAPILTEANVVRIDTQLPEEGRKAGPNFIFSN